MDVSVNMEGNSNPNLALAFYPAFLLATPLDELLEGAVDR